jgi:uncharacterized protein YprB with RNaseH-like and TPR domain
MESKIADRIRDVLRAPRGTEPLAAKDAGKRLAQPPAESTEAPVRSLRTIRGGEWCHLVDARCHVVEARLDAGARHGTETIATLATRLEQAGGEARILGGSAAGPPFVFFDLETTGLSGGAGTYAFLVGFGWFDGGDFVTRQYLLARVSDERPLLAAVSAELARAGSIVSFNGKSFDIPVLETRYLYHRLEWIGARLPHIDMLHHARRFWRREPPLDAAGLSSDASCSLTVLEANVLGAHRDGDVSGHEIPSRYFHFVRTGDARPLEVVFEHNRLDLLSLAALTARVLHLAQVGPDHALDPREALALGHVYSRAGLSDRARTAYLRAASRDWDGKSRKVGRPRTDGSSTTPIRIAALRALAHAWRRVRRHDEAADCWRQLLDIGGCPRHIVREANEALAIHHEHRVRDLEMARTFALRSLERGMPSSHDEGTRHRLARLDRKMDRLRARGASLEFSETLDSRVES